MRTGDRDGQGETWDRLTTGPSRGAGAQHLISGSRPENKHPLFQYPLPPGSGRCDGGSRNRYLACGGGMLCLLKPRTVTGRFPSRHNPHSSWGRNPGSKNLLLLPVMATSPPTPCHRASQASERSHSVVVTMAIGCRPPPSHLLT